MTLTSSMTSSWAKPPTYSATFVPGILIAPGLSGSARNLFTSKKDGVGDVSGHAVAGAHTKQEHAAGNSMSKMTMSSRRSWGIAPRQPLDASSAHSAGDGVPAADFGAAGL